MQGRGDRDNRYPVPDGFRQLLEALAREVLRGQPADVYGFSALFFKVLLDMRNEFNGENPIQKPELYDKFKYRLFTEAVHDGLVNSALLSSLSSKSAKSRKTADTGDSTENNSPQFSKTGSKNLESGSTRNKDAFIAGGNNSKSFTHHDDPERAATKIQANIRGYLTRKKFKSGARQRCASDTTHKRKIQRPTTLEDKAASKIQAGIRGFLTRKQLASAGIPVRSPTSSRSPLGSDSNSPRSPDVSPDVAASKIQAGVRGYLTRKQLAAKGVPVHSPTHSHPKSHVKFNGDPNANDAASKIQAGVRGYLTRKHLEQEGTRKSPARTDRRVTIANVDDAATKIQAGIRGFLTRKHLEAEGVRVRSGGTSPSSPTSPTGLVGHAGHSNHIGDDGIGSPDDAEEAAATKIQAAFRGHMVRQQFQQEKSEHQNDSEFI